MASLKPRGVAGGWLAGGWDLPQYSYLSPAKLGLRLSLAILLLKRVKSNMSLAQCSPSMLLFYSSITEKTLNNGEEAGEDYSEKNESESER